MTRYEYRTLSTDIAQLAEEELVKRLNAMGSEGWNLVAAVPQERHGYSHQVHLLFSRCLTDSR